MRRWALVGLEVVVVVRVALRVGGKGGPFGRACASHGRHDLGYRVLTRARAGGAAVHRKLARRARQRAAAVDRPRASCPRPRLDQAGRGQRRRRAQAAEIFPQLPAPLLGRRTRGGPGLARGAYAGAALLAPLELAIAPCACAVSTCAVSWPTSMGNARCWRD